LKPPETFVNNTDTLDDEPFATTRSGRPSPFRSAARSATGEVCTAVFTGAA
jgi:hypothetical protein